MWFDEEWRFAGRGGRGRRAGGPPGGGWGGGPPKGPPWDEMPGPGMRMRMRRVRAMLEERPPRADRGAVRYLVLDALRDAPRHGYEIMAAIEAKSQGAYRPSPGVVYPTLQLLEELGHVKATARDDKKVYALTADGTRDLEAHADEVDAFYEQSEDGWENQADEMFEVAHAVRRLVRTVRRWGRRGRLTPAKMAKVRALLERTAKELEELLEAP